MNKIICFGEILWDLFPTGARSGFTIETKDTVGAGDVFTAGFISGFIQKNLPGEVLRFVCTTGIPVVSATVAVPGYTVSEFEKLTNTDWFLQLFFFFLVSINEKMPLE